jgi:two-component system response regulator AtoC
MPHLLLVDDDPEALEWLSELAKAEGFTVATADSLRAARIHMSRLQPDIMLTDLQLPDGKGIELVNDLETRAATEVVMITGHASVETAVEALRLGATDYLVKPVDVERLKAILRRVPKTGELRYPRLLAPDAEALRPARARRADLGDRAAHRRKRHR